MNRREITPSGLPFRGDFIKKESMRGRGQSEFDRIPPERDCSLERR